MYDYNQLASNAKSVSDFLNSRGVLTKLKTSRYKSQIKAVEVSYNGSVAELFRSKGINGSLSDLSSTEEKNISGKYKAKLYTITTNSDPFKSGQKFFIVNTYTERGSIKTKDLAPEKFGLTNGVYTTLSTFDSAVLSGINNLPSIPYEIKNLLTSLYNSVAKNTLKTNSIGYDEVAAEIMQTIKPQDLQAIGKDFGEVLSLRWYVSQDFSSGFTEFGFSTRSNEPLVDYFVSRKVGGKNIKQNISAKFEAGAAPSIGAIIGKIDSVYPSPTEQEKKAINVLKSLADTSVNTSTKILKAYETLGLPAFETLKKILGVSTPTLQTISEAIQKIASASKMPKNRISMFQTEFSPIYEALNKTASSDSLDVVFSSNSYYKYYSLLLSPMGYALVDYMNKEPIYQEILNNISRQLKVEQVYLNFSNSAMLFDVKLFSKAEFKFSYGANAKDSDNTGIKFSMKQ